MLDLYSNWVLGKNQTDLYIKIGPLIEGNLKNSVLTL